MANHIFVTGDTHGWDSYGSCSVDGIYPRFNTKNFPEQKSLNKDDVVVIAGDFGGVWSFDNRYVSKEYQYLHNGQTHTPLPHGESPEEKHGLDWLNNKPFTTIFVPGNHENYSRLYHAYPIIDYCGGRAVQLRNSVFMLLNGYIFNICGKKIFAFGGASSHDIDDGILDPGDAKYHQDAFAFSQEYKRWREAGRKFRVKNASWWKEEIPDQDMMNRGLANLKKVGNCVDIILTHCCSTKLLKFFSNNQFESNVLTDYLQHIESDVNYKYWFFGHYHQNMTFRIKNANSQEIMLYEQIVQAC